MPSDLRCQPTEGRFPSSRFSISRLPSLRGGLYSQHPRLATTVGLSLRQVCALRPANSSRGSGFWSERVTGDGGGGTHSGGLGLLVKVSHVPQVFGSQIGPI